MPSSPNISKKKTIVRKSGKGPGLRKVSNKTRTEIAGTFEMKARREVVIGDELLHADAGIEYISEGGRVINFGGELLVFGKFAPQERQELLNEVENLGARKKAKSADDRVIRVKTTKDGFAVYTSKSNLAVAIGKHLHRSRKRGELTVTWSRHDLPVRVIWRADVEI